MVKQVLGSVPLYVMQTPRQKSPPSGMNTCHYSFPMWLINGIVLVLKKVLLRHYHCMRLKCQLKIRKKAKHEVGWELWQTHFHVQPRFVWSSVLSNASFQVAFRICKQALLPQQVWFIQKFSNKLVKRTSLHESTTPSKII